MAITRVPASKNWRDIVDEPEARRVFEALADPTWDFRTIEGLAQSTGLPESRVEEVLQKYRSFVRQSPVLDRRGRPLFTLSSKGATLQEWLSSLRAFLSKSTSTE
jgi:hypothetical protein